jgi:hypothetical protein
MTQVVNEIYTRIYPLYKDFLCKYGLAKQICTVRTLEGVFINDSLGKMRKFIKKLIEIQGQDSLNVVPTFDDLCLPDYCVTGKCFSGPQDQDDTDVDMNTAIIKKLIEMTSTKPSDIAICLFCVLNLSLKANNPPPIPYIDINEMKKAYYTLMKEFDRFNSIKSLKGGNVSAAAKPLQLAAQTFIQEKHRVYFKLTHEMNTIADDKTKDLREGVNKNIFEGLDGITTSLASYLDIQVQQQTKASEALKDKIYVPPMIQLGKRGVSKDSPPFQLSNFISVCTSFFKAVDNNNAASAIGTLDFMDQVSKYFQLINLWKRVGVSFLWLASGCYG